MEDQKIKIGKYIFNCIFAESEKDKQIGLQRIKKLPLNCGMCFSGNNDLMCMSMKMVNYPIDIIFVCDNKISKVYHNIKPKDTTPYCDDNVQYVIEINGGLCKKLNIGVNQPISI